MKKKQKRNSHDKNQGIRIQNPSEITYVTHFENKIEFIKIQKNTLNVIISDFLNLFKKKGDIFSWAITCASLLLSLSTTTEFNDSWGINKNILNNLFGFIFCAALLYTIYRIWIFRQCNKLNTEALLKEILDACSIDETNCPPPN